MTKARFFLVCLVAMFAFLACSQLASAQSKSRFHVKAVPAKHSDANRGATSDPTLTADLYALEAAFTALPPQPPTNSDGTDLWPCFGDSSTANPDCPTIGSPSETFPNGGVAVGVPQYVWSLPDCDGTTNGNVPCGQLETWYEDDSNDTSDDLLYSVEVVQGTSVILDSGTIDFGPNTFGGLTPPADVIFSGDLSFGALGDIGKNNGNCSADSGYPTSTDPGAPPFVIQANKTCVDPVAGVATVTATTEIAAPKYTKKTTAAACSPNPEPCYTVTYTKKYSISQKWNIYLQAPADSGPSSR